MEGKLVIQGRAITPVDIQRIHRLLADSRGLTRRRLSRDLCEQWNWRNAKGQVKDMACRSLLRKLDRRGLIRLPPPRQIPVNGRHQCSTDRAFMTPASIVGDLRGLLPLSITPVFPHGEEAAEFHHLLSAYHYLGSLRRAGENMKYLVRDREGRVVACALFGVAAWKTAPRDEHIGWDAQTRARNLLYVANNTRLLILPWVRVPHLASHVLGKLARRINGDWLNKYGHGLYLLETFVDKSRYRGTCYQAANWFCLGETKGRTRQDRDRTIRVAVKDIYVYPLSPDFREELCRVDA